MKKKIELSFRIWHWLNAVAILGILSTVLLRKTFLSYKQNATLLRDELAKLDIDITIESAKLIAKTIRTPMWEWHYIFGFSLIALLIYRVFLGFSSYNLKLNFKDRDFKKLSHIGVYVLITLMSLSGLILYFELFSEGFLDIVKEFHEILMYGFLIFIPVHIFKVVKSEVDSSENRTISKMVRGD